MSDNLNWLSEGLNSEEILSINQYSASLYSTDPDCQDSSCQADGACTTYGICSSDGVCSSDSTSVTADISVVGVTQNSITVFYGTLGEIQRNRTLKWYLDGILVESYEILGSQLTDEYTFRNLSPGTSYSIKLNMSTSTGYSKDYTTTGTTSYPDDSATLIYNVGLKSISVKLINVTPRTYSRTVRCNINGTLLKCTLASGVTESDTLEFTGLSPNTAYAIDIGIRVVDSDVSTRTWRDNSHTVYTANTNYTLTLSTSSTYNTITATAEVNAALSFDLDLTVYLNDERDLEIDIPAGSLSRSRTWTTSITPATKYAVKLWDKIKDEYQTINRRTKNNFHWSNSKWNMNVSKNEDFYINPDAWNEYTSQLSAKASYYDITYNPATVKAGDQLTAEKYNNIAATINKMVNGKKGDCKTKVSTVSAGDPVTAYSINILETCLNE